MARGAPVTIDDVEATLRVIESAGLTPTVRLVHQKLGRGSMSTITAHLRAVAAARADTEVGALPEPMLASLQSAANGIWAELSEAADARVNEISEGAERRVREATTARDDALEQASDAARRAGALTTELDAAIGRLRALEVALDAERVAKDAAERQSATSGQTIEGLRARLEDRDATLQRAVAEVDVAREHAEASRQERDRIARQLEGAATESAGADARHRERLERTEAALADERHRGTDLAAQLAWREDRSSAVETDRDALRGECAQLRDERDEAVRLAARDRALGEACAAERRRQDTENERLQARLTDLSTYVGRLEAHLVAAGLSLDALAFASDGASPR